MGRIRTYPLAAPPTVLLPARPAAPLRAIDVTVGGLALLLTAPLMAALALLVRCTSHGPVLHRDLITTADGRRVELLSFRTALDGARTEAAERVRAVIGASTEVPVTRPGRVLRALRLDRLPRLVNVVAGHVSFFG